MLFFRLKNSIPMLSALMASGLYAQQSLAQSSLEGSQIESVVVNGQSRTQELSKVPMAIQVISKEQLHALAANNLADLNVYVPSLMIDAHQPTQPKVTLRGLSNQDFLIGTDSPVGIYVDGVYSGKTGGALLNFHDVKRIEILKGPQGTLFGRNTAGGAISILTNEPHANAETSALIRLGNHGLRHSQVVLNRALSDDWALRFSSVTQQSRGALRDSQSGEAYGGDHSWGTRLALRWQGSASSRMILSWEHENLDQRARAIMGLGGGNPQSYLNPLIAPISTDVPDNREARQFNGVNLRIQHLSPWGDLSSNTSYRHFTTSTKEDSDGTTDIATALATYNRDRNTTWQQEFKINGKTNTVDWVAGVSFFDEKANQTSEASTTTTSLDTLFKNLSGGQLFPFGQITGVARQFGLSNINLLGLPWQESMFNVLHSRATAIYGDAIFPVSSATNLSFGLRYSQDEKQYSWRYPQRVAKAADAQLTTLNALGFFKDPKLAGLYYGIPSLGFSGVANNLPIVAGEATRETPLLVEKKWTDFSPRFVIDHQLNTDTMIFSSLTKGYQAGGFSGFNSNGSYAPETAVNLELGVKGQLPSLGLRYDASLFKFRFKNLQSLELVGIGSDGFPKYVTQSSDRNATGVDLHVQWQFSPSLRFYSNSEYIDLRYDSYTSNTGIQLDNQAVGTPSLSSAAGLDYTWSGAHGRWHAVLQAAYVSKVRCNQDTVLKTDCLRTPTFAVGTSQTRFDARLGWQSALTSLGGQWSLGLVVNNLFDKQYVAFVENVITRPFGIAYGGRTAPRKLMLEASVKF